MSSREEWKQMFDLIDEGGSGRIPVEKFGMCMRALYQYPTEEEVQAYIKAKDPKKRGFIDYASFCDCMEKQVKKPLDKRAAIDSFKVFDKDENGTINAMELKHVLVSMGEKLTQEEAENFVAEANIDKYGFIVIEDFLNAVTEKA